MKALLTALFALALAATPASAQVFTNLDFERAQVVVNNPTFGFLDWNLAAPGWAHLNAADTGIVYYRSGHLGLTPFYALVDAVSFSSFRLAGNYSFLLRNGYLTSDPNAPAVQTYLSQTGVIPGDARSVRLLATGPFEVLVGGVPIPMRPVGGNAYAGDISPFAGTTAEFRFVNTASSFPVLGTFVAVDNVEFSTTAVPEPSSLVLAGAVATFVGVCRRWRSGCQVGRRADAAKFLDDGVGDRHSNSGYQSLPPVEYSDETSDDVCRLFRGRGRGSDGSRARSGAAGACAEGG